MENLKADTALAYEIAAFEMWRENVNRSDFCSIRVGPGHVVVYDMRDSDKLPITIFAASGEP